MIDKFCEGVLQRIRKRKESYTLCLSTGSLKTMEDYKSICGKMQGLSEAEEIIKTMFNDFFGETKLNNRDETHD